MGTKVKGTIQTIIGVLLIIFGLAGMILPILPGWTVALFGLHLIGWRLVIRPKQPWYKKLRLHKE